MINDYISIESAQPIDLAVECDVVLDSSQSSGAVIAKVIEIISNYFNPLTRQLGQNVVVSELRRLIQAENGVISISDMKFFNLVGGQYSSFETSQTYSDATTRQIELYADTIFAEPSQIYQIRFPNKDITVRVLNLKTVSFS
jgi:hypothetical protein